MIKKKCSVLLLVVISLFISNLTNSFSSDSPKSIHTVKKNDTLWGICERYYGNADLWPKLWEMNPFVTNPHLLNPGDIITLLKEMPVKNKPLPQEENVPPKKIIGIDISGLTNVETMGYLSVQKQEPWGSILFDETERIMLSKGDQVYVKIVSGKEVAKGESFDIYRETLLIKHPVTGRILGYQVSIIGRIMLKDYLKQEVNDTLYKAEVVDIHKAVKIGDKFIPFEPISSCIQPMAVEDQVSTIIVAVKDQLNMIGQFSVVYLDKGSDNNIQAGNMFKVIKGYPENRPVGAFTPEINLGYILITNTGKKTSTGLVISSKKEFRKGLLLKGLDIESAQSIIPLFPTCEIKEDGLVKKISAGRGMTTPHPTSQKAQGDF